jgi:hypothetical protein
MTNAELHTEQEEMWRTLFDEDHTVRPLRSTVVHLWISLGCSTDRNAPYRKLQFELIGAGSDSGELGYSLPL